MACHVVRSLFRKLYESERTKRSNSQGLSHHITVNNILNRRLARLTPVRFESKCFYLIWINLIIEKYIRYYVKTYNQQTEEPFSPKYASEYIIKLIRTLFTNYKMHKKSFDRKPHSYTLRINYIPRANIHFFACGIYRKFFINK